MKHFITLILSLFILNTSVFACPDVAGVYPNINGGCSANQFLIAAFGDSLVYGRNDKFKDKFGGTTGGWVLRIKKYLQQIDETIDVKNYGQPGKQCKQIKTKLKHEIKKGKFAKFADLVFISCGLNDYFGDKDSQKTAVTIKSMLRYAEKRGIYSVAAYLTHTQRDYQEPWVNEVNEKLQGIATLHFETLSPIYMTDSIHPNAKGYGKLFKKVKKFVNNVYPVQSRPADSDFDGIYDKDEVDEFGTDPNNPDTDFDGHSDFDEIFNLLTNPLASE